MSKVRCQKSDVINSKKAFTLLELIVSVTLLFIVGIGASFVLDNQLHGTLEADAEVMASRLIEAQSRAIAGVNNSGWGMRFHNATNTAPYYALFQGAAFTTSSRTYFPSNLIEFESPIVGTTTDIVFTKLSGTLARSSTIIIRLKTDNAAKKTVSISKNGSISVE